VDLDEALSELVRTHGDRLLHAAYQLTHDRARAQDLVQEAVLRVYRSSRRRGRGPEHLQAYLLRVMLNEYLRGRRLRASTELISAVVSPLAAAPRFEDEVAERTDLWRMLEHLPARQRAVLVLRYYESIPDREIAGLLGCREATVRSLASRALSALRGAELPISRGPRGGRS
jgi:RNA polymerase sigma factor (sigma-70 family)